VVAPPSSRPNGFHRAERVPETVTLPRELADASARWAGAVREAIFQRLVFGDPAAGASQG